MPTPMLSDNAEKSISILQETTVLDRNFTVYGTYDEPLFLAKDIAEMIDYAKRSDGSYQVGQMLKTVDEEEKLPLKLLTAGQNREMWFLTENGVYEVLFQSTKPVAKEFKKEVKKILHKIRITGGYKIPQTYSEALQLCADQTRKIEEMQPKVEVFDRICNAENLKPVETVATNLGYGKNSFFAMMRGMGIFFYSAKDSNGRKCNLPKQEYKDRGYFVTKEEPYTSGDKDYLYTKIYVTGKGETWLAKILSENDVKED